MSPPRFSVVIPTFQRRQLVVAAVRAFARQNAALPFDVIVVVDGSTDGTAAALRELDVPFPLTVLEQANVGAAAARNRGAEAGRGELLLFLDDDMESDPSLLAEHDRSHRAGADVVTGHVPLHPKSPPGFLAAAVGHWAEDRARNLSEPSARLTAYDLLTGQLSVGRETFARVGGFDPRFTRGGTYGNEDLDFAQRLLDAGCVAVFNGAAISRQRYVVTPTEHLRQWRETGRADVGFARKHAAAAAAIVARRGGTTLPSRIVRIAALHVPGAGAVLAGAARPAVLAVAARGGPWRPVFRAFRFVRDLEYWRGVREAGGLPRPRALIVLAYHAVADLAEDPLLADYAVPPIVLRAQLAALARTGFHFVDADEALRMLRGEGGLPRRAVLLTFDDCYEDLRSAVVPLLEERGAAAVAFAVTRRLGRVNDWDTSIGAAELRLLGPDGLLELSRRGLEIGGHTRTHPRLVRLPPDDAEQEVAGCRDDLAAIGLLPRLFAYPYGEHDARTRAFVRAAGFEAAFGIDAGCVRPGDDPFRLSRIEIMRGDMGVRLLWKLTRALIRR